MAIITNIPIAVAADNGGDNGINQTNASQPYYITIDPIGNHSINDVLLIHGTTNLPVSNDSIHFWTVSESFTPAGWGSRFDSNISIQPGENGVNFWSVNATTDRWITFPGPVPGAVPGEYVAAVWLKQDSTVSASQLFFLLPPENIIPNQTIVTVPTQNSPMIQPTTGAAPHTTTPSSPVPMALPVAVLAAMVIARAGSGRKQ